MKIITASGPEFLLEILEAGFSQVSRQLTKEQFEKCKHVSIEINELLEAKCLEPVERLSILLATTGATMQGMMNIYKEAVAEQTKQNVQEGNSKVN